MIDAIFALSIFTWIYNCLLEIIISYLKSSNCVQTNDCYKVEIIIWNYMIVRIRSYLPNPSARAGYDTRSVF